MQRLKRVTGLGGAVVIGLGSILGTGVFVSLAIAADIAGAGIMVAVVIAGMIATLNGFSSAGLAAAYPVSGGAYEYGYHFVNPLTGFIAGWMFLIAKGASAATAALGFSGYLWGAMQSLFGAPPVSAGVGVATAVLISLGITCIVSAGIRRTSAANAVIVTITVGSLLFFVATGALARSGVPATSATQFLPDGGISPLLHATALVFVAFTGYGRIATLGEEVKDPQRTIPRAVIITLLVTVLLYAAVAFVGFTGDAATASQNRSSLSPALQSETGAIAPLAERAGAFIGRPGVAVLSVGAVTAMAGVLLNLVLGLSRVLLAMGRRRDMPRVFERLNRSGTTPLIAVWGVGIFVAGLTLFGDVRLTWSFSAFTVLVYYAITNFAALKIPSEHRIYPKWISVCGLVGCTVPAFFVDQAIWLSGLGLILAGALWHRAAKALRSRPSRR